MFVQEYAFIFYFYCHDRSFSQAKAALVEALQEDSEDEAIPEGMEEGSEEDEGDDDGSESGDDKDSEKKNTKEPKALSTQQFPNRPITKEVRMGWFITISST